MAVTNELIYKIVKWFKEDDRLVKADDVCKYFSEESVDDINNALEFLCQKGVLYSSDTFCGVLFGLTGM